MLSRYKEQILYLIFGGLTFVVSVGVYTLFVAGLSMNELVANIISWIAAVTFAFFTNRKWVFNSKRTGKADVGKEMVSFLVGRLATLVVEEVILFIFISILDLNSIVVKIVAQCLVIILNYIVSKVWIFAKK